MASGDHRPARLVLLECVTLLRQRVDRAQLFPFWEGWAQDRGIPVRWVCVGGRGELEPAGQSWFRPVVNLEEDDARRLCEDLRRWGATHILANEELATEWTRRLTGAIPGISIIGGLRSPEMTAWTDRIREEADRAGTMPARWRGDSAYTQIDVWQRERWLSRWIGLQDPEARDGPAGRRVADVAEPRYDAEMFNEAATRLEPMIRIVGGVFCDWTAPLRDNPAYRGVDLSESSRDFGCAFCAMRTPSPATGDPIDLAERQFRRLLSAGTRPARDSGRYDFYDIRLFLRIDEWVARATALGIPPSEFCFSPRVNHVLQARDRLRKALPLCAAHGYVVRLFRIGAENVSEAEQERFNKGVSTDQIEEALALFREFESRWPGTFQATQPLAFITFTPWTTLDEVRLLLEKAVRWRFPPRGRWLFCTLEMDRDQPITALARAAGDLVVPQFEDPAFLYSSSVAGFLHPSQVAWRFRDRRVATYHAVLVRYCAALERAFPDTVFHGDPLYQEIQDRIREDGGRAATPLAFAQTLVRALDEDPSLTDPGDLWRRACSELVRLGLSGPPMRSRMTWLIRRVLEADQAEWNDLHLEDLLHDEGAREATLRLRTRGRPCAVRMVPAGEMEDPDIRSDRFAGKLEEAFPQDRPFLLARLGRLFRALDALVPRHAPLFLADPREATGTPVAPLAPLPDD
ncbi:MAG TPA: hypothetical protein PLQ97_03515 [Myxococcota bacterium]|nr:hypothetical protein [Myxococcota bacterium]HQK50076.1 hypothetical protein [Myxococcota bacterium]